MIQRNRADRDVRDGGVFAEAIEKTGVRDFGFSERCGSYVLQGRKRLRTKNAAQAGDQMMALWLILNEIWKSKIEIVAVTEFDREVRLKHIGLGIAELTMRVNGAASK